MELFPFTENSTTPLKLHSAKEPSNQHLLFSILLTKASLHLLCQHSEHCDDGIPLVLAAWKAF
jgi:hypothetical protein